MHTFWPPSIRMSSPLSVPYQTSRCASDVLPTRILKENVDVLAPFLAELYNRSLMLGVVPSAFKAAYITPLLKKPDLDPADVKSYRPISNLLVILKLLERLVATQLLDYLITLRLLPDLQSAYRANHSTETAVLKVLVDILRAVDSSDLTVLSLLDLSAAFDTVDHTILLCRLNESYGPWWAVFTSGLCPTSTTAHNSSAMAHPGRPQPSWCVGSHKGRSLG